MAKLATQHVLIVLSKAESGYDSDAAENTLDLLSTDAINQLKEAVSVLVDDSSVIVELQEHKKCH